MTIRKFIISSSIVAVSSLGFAGIAAADSVWVPTKTEEGVVFKPDHGPKSNVTREQIKKDAKLAKDFGAGRVSPDGWRFVGGERGWVVEGHKIDYVDGKWTHVDKIDHNAKKPSPKMTAKEKAQYDALYGNSAK